MANSFIPGKLFTAPIYWLSNSSPRQRCGKKWTRKEKQKSEKEARAKKERRAEEPTLVKEEGIEQKRIECDRHEQGASKESIPEENQTLVEEKEWTRHEKRRSEKEARAK